MEVELEPCSAGLGGGGLPLLVNWSSQSRVSLMRPTSTSHYSPRIAGGDQR